MLGRGIIFPERKGYAVSYRSWRRRKLICQKLKSVFAVALLLISLQMFGAAAAEKLNPSHDVPISQPLFREYTDGNVGLVKL